MYFSTSTIGFKISHLFIDAENKHSSLVMIKHVLYIPLLEVAEHCTMFGHCSATSSHTLLSLRQVSNVYRAVPNQWTINRLVL